MDVKVLGACCGKCDDLVSLVREVVAEKGLNATVEKIGDDREIGAYGMVKLPGLVVDGQVVAHGRVPSKAEIANWLSSPRG